MIDLQVLDSGYPFGGESIAPRLTDRNVAVHTSQSSSAQLTELISDSDVVHLHGVWDRSFHRVIATCRTQGIPYIIRPCGMLDPWSLRQKRFKKWMYRLARLNGHLRHASAIHFTTQEEANLAGRFHRADQRLVEPNGVFLDDFTTTGSSELRRDWGVPDHAPLAIFLGRIHPKKGTEYLIHALQLKPNLNLHLVIAGSGDQKYVDRVRQLAAGDTRIHFVGMLEGSTKKSALATADFFVLTSYQENFGNAVVEAMASGTPVLISPGVNLASVVKKRGVGEVVELDDASVADALERWAEQPELIASYAENCRDTVAELFDWREIGQRWIGHYQRLINRAARH